MSVSQSFYSKGFMCVTGANVLPNGVADGAQFAPTRNRIRMHLKVNRCRSSSATKTRDRDRDRDRTST